MENFNFITGKCDPNSEVISESCASKFGRTFNVSSEEELKNKTVIYVGKGDNVLMNFIYNWPENDFFIFENQSLIPAQVSVSKFLMKRYFLVEKTKDADRIGLLVGTLGASKYSEIIEIFDQYSKRIQVLP